MQKRTFTGFGSGAGMPTVFGLGRSGMTSAAKAGATDTLATSSPAVSERLRKFMRSSLFIKQAAFFVGGVMLAAHALEQIHGGGVIHTVLGHADARLAQHARILVLFIRA